MPFSTHSILNRLLLPLAAPLFAGPNEPSSSSADNEKFLDWALQDSLAEVELCEMALQKTSNDDVKLFSQRMIDDHSEMGREIERMADNKRIALPKNASKEEQSTYDELSRLSGEEFDRRFIESNIRDHEKDIRTCRSQAGQLTDPDIKAFAEKGIRILTRHLELATQIGNRLPS